MCDIKSIIFGVNGQDGYYLQELLRSRGMTVCGVSRCARDGVRGDVALFADVDDLVAQIKPDFIFHLAANSTTRHEALFENHATISLGTLNVLEAVRRHQPECRVFITGSGVQFRNVGQPISERDPFEATSAYAVARIQSAYAARYYRTLGIKVYVGYLFHHESPLRQPTHVCKLIADAVKRIGQGSRERIPLGDVSVRKEHGFAGDIAKGIWALVSQENVFEATIGTGVAYSIQDWLEFCFSQVGRDWRDYVDLNPDALRPEYRMLVSDPSTMGSLGWKAKVGISELAEMMLK